MRVTDVWWLWAHGPTRTPATGYCGKWLLFSPPETVAETWGRVRDATEAGKLGHLAKVATGKWGPSERVVICVYTADCRDLADVTRVLAELRAMGFGGRLNYKEDAATYAGVYAGDRRGPASLYTSASGLLIRTLRPIIEPTRNEPSPGGFAPVPMVRTGVNKPPAVPSATMDDTEIDRQLIARLPLITPDAPTGYYRGPRGGLIEVRYTGWGKRTRKQRGVPAHYARRTIGHNECFVPSEAGTS